jgi:tetratricopeptide (TPR) repeat protein
LKMAELPKIVPLACSAFVVYQPDTRHDQDYGYPSSHIPGTERCKGDSVMMRPVFLVRLLPVIVAAVMPAFFSVPTAFCQERSVDEAGAHNRQGMEYFKKGYYDHAPRNQGAEAERNYGLAVKEFKAAISADSSSAEAHRNLARVYYVQKNFDGAAEEYKRVAEFAPGDLDAYVNHALALIELKRSAEAIRVLEDAKGHACDAKARETLDSYIEKVRTRQENEVR